MSAAQAGAPRTVGTSSPRCVARPDRARALDAILSRYFTAMVCSIKGKRSRMQARTARFALPLGAALGVLGACPGFARADVDSNRALAQSLFDRGRELLEARRFAEACPLFDESQRLDPAGGTRLNLAVCREQEGRLATAHAEFKEALSQAIRDGRGDREAIAKEHLADLAPRLSTFVIVVPPDAEVPGLQLSIDGAALGRAAWGTPTPVDGGAHRVEASAPDRRYWFIDVEIAGTNDLRRIEIPALPPLQPSPGPLSPPACPAGWHPAPSGCAPKSPRRTESAAPHPSLPAAESRFSAASLWVGGVSLGLVVTSAVTGALALSTQSSAKELAQKAGCLTERGYCRDSAAAPPAIELYDRAHALGWVSTVTLGVGAVGAGIALLLPRVQHGTTTASATVVPGGLGLSIEASLP